MGKQARAKAVRRLAREWKKLLESMGIQAPPVEG